MTTAIPLTLHLLVIIGVYELAAGLAGLFGTIDWVSLLDEFERSPALTFLTGFMVYILGAAVILLHHHWTDPLAIIISLIAWLAPIEGLLMMIAPGPLFRFSKRLVASQRAISFVAILFGALLVILGLTGRADPTAL